MGPLVPDKLGNFQGATTASSLTLSNSVACSSSNAAPSNPSPELGSTSPVTLSFHASTLPNLKCCTTGAFLSTSSLYILVRPLLTLDHVGTVEAMLWRSGECSAKGPVLRSLMWRIDERKRYEIPCGETERGERIEAGRRVGWAVMMREQGLAGEGRGGEEKKERTS